MAAQRERWGQSIEGVDIRDLEKDSVRRLAKDLMNSSDEDRQIAQGNCGSLLAADL